MFGLLCATWSAKPGIKSDGDALNATYQERESRSLVRLNLATLAFTTAGLLAILLMMSVVVAFPPRLDRLGRAPDSQLILSLVRWPLMLAVLLVGLGVLYRFGPSRRPLPAALALDWRRRRDRRAALDRGLDADVLLPCRFRQLRCDLRSLGAAIGLMSWMWMSAILVLFGAELNLEIERQAAAAATIPKRPGTLSR